MARFPHTLSSAQSARRFVEQQLSGLPPSLVERAIMLVSELATNAILHARSDFELSVSFPVPGSCVRIEVADAGGGEPRPQQPPPTAEHGRGLQLVAALSNRWGVERQSDGGKTVWFELSVTPADARGRLEGTRSAFKRPPPELRFSPLSLLGLQAGLA